MKDKENELRTWGGKVVMALVLVITLVGGLSAQEIDLLLKGGHVIDPKNKVDSQMDVAIVAGKIFRVAADIPSATAKKTVDVSGLFVTPGIIDMHTHVFTGYDTTCISANSLAGQQADAFSFRAGVTTMVDAGSAGWRNFPLFMGTEKLEAELTFRAGRVLWDLNGMNATDWVMSASTN